jgi:hypothetical protein
MKSEAGDELRDTCAFHTDTWFNCACAAKSHCAPSPTVPHPLDETSPRDASACCLRQEITMLDGIAILSFFIFFPACALYVHGCDRLKGTH